MKLLISLSTTFIFCFCIGVGLSNGQTVQDTPLMAKYRKYYEENDLNLGYIISTFSSECKEKCDEKDKMVAEQLAKQGDMFGAAVLPQIKTVLAIKSGADTSPKEWNLFVKESADFGEPFNASVYVASLLYQQNYDEAKKYIDVIKKAGSKRAYGSEAFLYLTLKDEVKFCATQREHYKKIGLESIGSYIFRSENLSSKIFFSKCTKKTPAEIISMAGKEGQLIKGYSLVDKKNYDEAYKSFSNAYTRGDTSKISSNAGYCLGMMNYYGKGTRQDKKKGRALLKEAFDNGVYYGTTPEQKQYTLPPKLERITYSSALDLCDAIK